jgi:hypothetical protein
VYTVKISQKDNNVTRILNMNNNTDASQHNAIQQMLTQGG